MADNEFQVESIGEVYAQALFNEAQKQGAQEEVTEQVRGIGGLLKSNAAFRGFTQALTVNPEDRIGALEKIFGGRVHPLVLEAIKSMSRRDRIMFLRGFVEAYETILKKISGQVDVSLVSAHELRPDVMERVKQAVGRSVGKSANMKVKVDGSLIGGMTLTVGDTLIDGSVATQLHRMRDQLKRKGTGELKLSSMVG